MASIAWPTFIVAPGPLLSRSLQPVKAGKTVEARLSAATVEVWYEGKRVARHERSYGRYQEILDLEHYLDVLERKPGALAGSKPLEQWRRLGRWPES
jgi:hypothetical protein